MDFGIIGNCKTAALVTSKGTINWCCMPDFDSSSIFAQLLDAEKGGHFGIEVKGVTSTAQRYLPNTNILETTYNSDEGSFKVLDFMPRYKNDDGSYCCPPDIVRYFKLIEGRPSFRIRYKPGIGYAKYPTITTEHDEYIKSHSKAGVYESVYLYTDLEKSMVIQGDEITLKGASYILLSYHQKILPINIERIELEFQRTKVYWLEWIHRSIDFKGYVADIRRSALVLKLLSYQESGAILAAITTSLPETVKEERNWDYRFCWIRDASMILNVLTQLGHFNVARNFVQYILNVVPYKNDKVQIMYGIRGQKDLNEQTLDWLSGYKNSKPVRIGNAAYMQKQNDIYGVLLDVIYKYIEAFHTEIDTVERLWTATRSLVKTVCDSWQKPDMGIWEFRSRQAHFVFSKVLCWVALDRGSKIANVLNKQEYMSQWKKERTRIKQDILQNGWDAGMGTFTQAYGSKEVDASNLLLADYGFLSPTDSRFVSTVKVTQKALSRNGLMYRYKNKDDFGEPHSCFSVCSFWLVKALWQTGQKKQARTLFDKLLSYRNHLGLMSEDLDFETKEMLGNFPQGYSHLALINCALALCEGDMNEESELVDFIQHNERVESEI